ncbi:MAG: zf-HC2 domain-containing protein [Acidobacteria bacterium]|nr:zf-HC2 domain-containing protein [Acidobacteriota bacterium]
MNCEECQLLISEYLDNELSAEFASAVGVHLAGCPPCAKLYEDFAVILGTCDETAPAESVPPNPKALWCRISNTIESDISSEARAAAKGAETRRVRRWNFSFAQTATAVVCVALISSLLTLVGLRNYFEPTGSDFTTRSEATETSLEKYLGKVGLVETPSQARIRRAG